MFDVDRDDVLNASEIKEMINILLFVSQDGSNSNNVRNVTYDQVYTELYERNMGKTTIEDASILDTAAIDTFNVTQEDFMMWSVQSQLNLVQPFLDLIFEVCHIVLGQRPQCRHLEYNIGKTFKLKKKIKSQKHKKMFSFSLQSKVG